MAMGGITQPASNVTTSNHVKHLVKFCIQFLSPKALKLKKDHMNMPHLMVRSPTSGDQLAMLAMKCLRPSLAPVRQICAKRVHKYR